MSADHDDGLTVAEAAASTGYSLGMIRTWIRQGTLPARQVPGHGYHGHQYRIDPADLDALVANRGRDPLANQIRRALKLHADEFPEPTDDQIRLIARLLPRPARRDGAA